MHVKPWYSRLNWTNTLFLIISPLIVLSLVPVELYFRGLDYRLFTLFVVSCFATSISITGGYHRLFAHRSYQAHWLVRLFYLVFGAAALQGSAIKWCSDHRRHHRNVDTEKDPYSIKKGFFYAHIGWVFLKEPKDYEKNFAADLTKDPLVQWQHKYYVPLAIIFGFLLPTLVGWMFGRPDGGLLYGGFARVVLTHHCTFFINSLCHMWGSRPFTHAVTARDNFVLAFLTYGEGYHNFHHKFEADYRNGFRWYHWDPTKWLIKALSYLKLTSNLRKIPETEILRAKLAVQEQHLRMRGYYDERMAALRVKVEEAHRKIQQMKMRYNEIKRDRRMRIDFELAKIELRAALRQWQRAYALAC